MILSVSRRTDIPAFYADWFFNRIEEGYVLVRNPMNYHQISKVDLSPSVIDCIVFWTKDPTNMLDKLPLLHDYKYYFQVTINTYDKKIERNTSQKTVIIDSFKNLSDSIGKEKTIWRYDPIIITEEIDIDYHCKNFEILAKNLENYTDYCIISFVDLYRKLDNRIKGMHIKNINAAMMLEIGEKLFEIGRKYNIKIETCSEMIDLSSVGILHGKCIDDALISQILEQKIVVGKDLNQRDICGCVSSVDIGAYNTCMHGCIYCYANYIDATVRNNSKKHNPKSPLLIGEIEPEDKITERKMTSYINPQLDFFGL